MVLIGRELIRVRLRRKHWTELEALADGDACAARVAELNVHQSIGVLEQHPAIKKAIVERGLTIHGLIYDLATGQLKVLEQTGGKTNMNNVVITSGELKEA